MPLNYKNLVIEILIRSIRRINANQSQYIHLESIITVLVRQHQPNTVQRWRIASSIIQGTINTTTITDVASNNPKNTFRNYVKYIELMKLN